MEYWEDLDKGAIIDYIDEIIDDNNDELEELMCAAIEVAAKQRYSKGDKVLRFRKLPENFKHVEEIADEELVWTSKDSGDCGPGGYSHTLRMGGAVVWTGGFTDQSLKKFAQVLTEEEYAGLGNPEEQKRIKYKELEILIKGFQQKIEVLNKQLQETIEQQNAIGCG